MSQAEDLLYGLTEEEIELMSVEPETEGHIVVGSDRKITVPEGLRRIAVQYDHRVETVTFDCPRYWDGLDMSTMVVLINYRLANGEIGCYPADNVTVDETDDTIMHFDWTVTRNVTPVNGKLSFLVCVKKTDEDGDVDNHWNSELCSDMYISEGLECTEHIEEEYPDLISSMLLSLNNKVGESVFNSTIAELRSEIAAGGGGTSGGAASFEEVSESEIDGLSNVLGTNFYKVTPGTGSFEHSYFMINSMDENVGIIAATCFQMRFKETIETRIYDAEMRTWGEWIEVSGGSGGADLSDYYTREEVDSFYNDLRETKKDNVWVTRQQISDTFICEVELVDNVECYYSGEALSIHLYKSSHFSLGNEHSIVFTTYDSGDITLVDNAGVKWIGDDCNAEGVFTPQAQTTYEVHFKNYDSNGIVARVGAC